MKKRSIPYLTIIILFIIGALFGLYKYRAEINDAETKLFENLRNIFFVLGGFIATVLAIWRATIADKNYQNELKKLDAHQLDLENDRDKFKTQQLNERYAKAIELLGNSSISVRIGAMYTLSQLGLEDDFYKNTLNEILTAYIRNELLSDTLKNERKEHLGKIASWKVQNKEGIANLHYESCFKNKPYLRIPEDIKTALSILENSEFEEINLSSTNWSGFDFSELKNKSFTYFNFENSDFSHTTFWLNQKFVDCILSRVNFDWSFIPVVEFKDDYNDEMNKKKRGKGSISGSFENTYFDHPVFSKILSLAVFKNVFFRAGMVFSPKVKDTHHKLSHLIFTNCFFGPVIFNARIENWYFHNCYFERTDLMASEYPLRFVFFDNIQGIVHTDIFKKVNNVNIPKSSKEITEQSNNVIFMDDKTFQNQKKHFKNFEYDFEPIKNVTDKLTTSWPSSFKTLHNILLAKPDFYFGLIIKKKETSEN